MSIVKRYPDNPILTAQDIPYPVSTVHNAGIAKVGDEIVMLFRSHENTGRSILGLARSKNGTQFTPDPAPLMRPIADGPLAKYETFGVEDPRITHIEGRYLITYSAYSKYGVRIGLAETIDFKTINRLGYITQPDHRNIAIFPEKINGKYVRLDRPHSHINSWSMWASFSEDLIHWGDSEIVLNPQTYHWTEMKIGPGAPPIKTEAGWLNIFHGVFDTMAGAVYRLGVCLHDLKNPAKLVGCYDGWILEPQTPHERTGYVPNVVFTCGAIKEGDQIRIYWGAADTVMCTGTAKISDLIALCA